MDILQEAEFWVAIGLAIFVGALIWAKVPGMALKALDSRGVKIQEALAEAQRLRDEAQALLDSIKTQRAESERLAAEMLANAQAEAVRLSAEAAVKLKAQIKRRQDLAERKIAIAETQAAADVKAAAADLAAQVAETILAGRLKGLKSDPLIDHAVDQIAGKLQ